MENNEARADFERWGLSEGSPGCGYLRTGQGRQQAHSEACRRMIEDLLKGDPVGSARLAAADERINRALADAVERHATKDPGVRGILKKSNVTPSQNPRRELRWTQSRIRHHNLVSHTGDRLRQVCDPAPSVAPTKAPARAT